MDDSKKYNDLVHSVAKDIFESMVDQLHPEQYDNELMMDIMQDVWLELFRLKHVDPSILDDEISEHLRRTEFVVSSLPDVRSQNDKLN